MRRDKIEELCVNPIFSADDDGKNGGGGGGVRRDWRAK